MRYLVLVLCLVNLIVFAQEGSKLDSLKKDDPFTKFIEPAQVEAKVDLDQQISFENINVDPRLNLLLKKRIAYHEENPYIEGYRVQLRKSDNMAELMEIRSKFLELFPNDFIKIEGNLPNFLLRVGNYLGAWGIWEAKLQAEVLKRHFDRAVYVRTSIYVHDLMVIEENKDDRQD